MLALVVAVHVTCIVVRIKYYYVHVICIGPPTAELVNDSPRVSGNNVIVEFILSDVQSVLTSVMCSLTGPGRTPPVLIEDCKLLNLMFLFQELLKSTASFICDDGIV